jgi:hypothetical protein
VPPGLSSSSSSPMVVVQPTVRATAVSALVVRAAHGMIGANVDHWRPRNTDTHQERWLSPPDGSRHAAMVWSQRGRPAGYELSAMEQVLDLGEGPLVDHMEQSDLEQRMRDEGIDTEASFVEQTQRERRDFLHGLSCLAFTPTSDGLLACTWRLELGGPPRLVPLFSCAHSARVLLAFVDADHVYAIMTEHEARREARGGQYPGRCDGLPPGWAILSVQLAQHQIGQIRWAARMEKPDAFRARLPSLIGATGVARLDVTFPSLGGSGDT